MSIKPKTRPKIEVERLPSNERAKIHLDGVQLHAEYQHYREASYVQVVNNAKIYKSAGPSGAKVKRDDDGELSDSSDVEVDERKSGVLVKSLDSVHVISAKTTTATSAKSCDNIFVAALNTIRKSPYAWKSSTRSEEHLRPKRGIFADKEESKTKGSGSQEQRRGGRVSSSASLVGAVDSQQREHQPLKRMTSHSVPSSPCGSQVLQKSSTMPHPRLKGNGAGQQPKTGPQGRAKVAASFASFLRKLSPRLRRSPPKGNEKPWIVVEFTRQDIDGEGSRQKGRTKQRVAESAGAAGQSSTIVESVPVVVPTITTRAPDASTGHSDLSTDVVLQQDGNSNVSDIGASGSAQSSASSHKPHQQRMTVTVIPPPAGDQGLAVVASHAQTATSPSRFVQMRKPGEDSDFSQIMRPEQALRSSSKIVPRPHSLNIRNKIIVRNPQGEIMSTKIASCDSIGTCSLDVDVTASESSVIVDQISVSQRTLLSSSIENTRTPDPSCPSTSRGLNSPNYVRKTIRFFDERSSTEPDTEPRLYTNGVTTTEHRPSYLNLACSISGYTGITQYDSKLREGLHSRDSSPARFAFPYSKREPSHITTNMNGGSHRELEPSVKKDVQDDVVDACAVQPALPSTPKLSFVEQRVERLYGPGMLGQVLKTRVAKKDIPPKEKRIPVRPLTAPPPVFHHLRPEFRRQLQWVEPRAECVPLAGETNKHEPCASQCPSSDTGTAQVPGAVDEKELASAYNQMELEKSHENKPAIEPVPILSPIDVVPPSERSGHKYLKIMRAVCRGIEEQIALAEKDLQLVDISEDIYGRLRAAIGKGRLLLGQKMEQFAGLCNKNICQEENEPFPTTAEDLAGFWEMVEIQVDDVQNKFNEISMLRLHDWDTSAIEETDELKVPVRTLTTKRRPATARPVLTSEASASRSKERRRMMEEKRRELRQAQSKKKDGDDVEIFCGGKN